jgi:hypothetical protein
MLATGSAADTTLDTEPPPKKQEDLRIDVRVCGILCVCLEPHHLLPSFGPLHTQEQTSLLLIPLHCDQSEAFSLSAVAHQRLLSCSAWSLPS